MASLRRKENFAAVYCGVWYWARANRGPGLDGCSRTKANLLSCSLRKRFMVHGQKSDSAMLAQLILIRRLSRAVGSETADLRLNSFGSQHFAWTFLALDSNGPKDSKQIPDTDWKHAAPTVYGCFPNKTRKYLDSFQIWPTCPESSLKSWATFYVSRKATQKATSGCQLRKAPCSSIRDPVAFKIQNKQQIFLLIPPRSLSEQGCT